MTDISAFHAHVYFNAGSLERARALCEQARDRFGIKMGQVHERAIGPHPEWSCQLAFAPDKFADVVPWLALNRDGLIVLVHPETGDELKDHTEHALWMGAVLTLDTSIFA